MDDGMMLWDTIPEESFLALMNSRFISVDRLFFSEIFTKVV
jgi:hypothetical protein